MCTLLIQTGRLGNGEVMGVMGPPTQRERVQGAAEMCMVVETLGIRKRSLEERQSNCEKVGFAWFYNYSFA